MTDVPDQHSPGHPHSEPAHDLKAAVENVADGILVLDGDARVLFANPAATGMLGRPLAQLLGQPLGFPLVTGTLAEVSMLRPDRSIATAEMRVAHTEWGGVPAFVVSLHETTAQRAAQRELAMWATVFSSSRELILIADENHRIVAINHTFEEISGYRGDEVRGHAPEFLFTTEEGQAGLDEAFWPSLIPACHWHGELRLQRRGGAPLPIWAAISATEDKEDHTRQFILIGTDISDRKAAEARIEYLAYHDALTGPVNRVAWPSPAQTVLASGSAYCTWISIASNR